MVLDKIIIHLKNILFFKAVIYMLAIIGLLIAMPIVSEELDQITKKIHLARSFLTQANVKLSLLSDFESKLEEINSSYLAIQQTNTKDFCLQRRDLVDKINQLLEKEFFVDEGLMHLNTVPDKSELRSFEQGLYHMNDILEIKNYRGFISFKTDKPESFISIVSRISELLPKNTVIVAVTLQEIQTLSPQLLDKLSKDKTLMRLDVRIELIVREIEYSS